jgi:hypothetical protein
MSFVRIAASVAIFTLLSVACAMAKPIVVSTDTNLRKSASTDSEVVTLIPKGMTVEIGKCSNGWCEASLDGKDGFVIARNVGMAPRRPPPGSDVEEIHGGYGPPTVYGPPAVYGPPVVYGPYYGGYGYGRYGRGRRW